MRVMVNDFVHRPGVHCGSTAMRDMLEFNGITLTEAAAFGLGAGLDFYYFQENTVSPMIFAGGRSSDVETRLCENLGIRYELKHPPEDDAWPGAKKEIDAGRPVMVSLDMFYLKYLGTHDHFGLHRVILAGYDDEREEIYVADRELEGLQTASYEEVRQARISSAPPFPPDNLVYEFVFPEKPTPLEDAFSDAFSRARRAALEPGHPLTGLEAIKYFADDLRLWSLRMDEKMLRSMARLTYIFFEVGGTGGGNFRRLWGRFLFEFAEKLKRPELKKIGEKFHEAADQWTLCAMQLRNTAKTGDMESIKTASQALLEAMKIESEAWKLADGY